MPGTAPERGETVFDRNRPDFDAKGIPAGGFRVFPSLTVRQAYDDNVFATDVDEEGDVITLISPEIDVRSEWSRHSLVFNAFADIERFARISTTRTPRSTARPSAARSTSPRATR